METVNLFFSCDDNYIPFLGVALTSLKENRDPSRRYCIRILNTGLNPAYREKLEQSFSEPAFSLQFCDISAQVSDYARQLHTRDYFSQSTYYRLFIPDMFPELDKALYLDSDLAVLGNIAELYDTELGDNLVGAVPDGAVAAIGPFRAYVEKRLQVKADHYFNAGILLMNLKAMREFRFQQVFLELLDAVTFHVAQDQDYLNVICRDRTVYLGPEWNAMPNGAPVAEPKLIHYNLDSKPWHSDHVHYDQYFWDYAARSPFRQEVRQIRAGYSQADTAKSAAETVNLIALATRQAEDDQENRAIHAQIARVVHP